MITYKGIINKIESAENIDDLKNIYEEYNSLLIEKKLLEQKIDHLQAEVIKAEHILETDYHIMVGYPSVRSLIADKLYDILFEAEIEKSEK